MVRKLLAIAVAVGISGTPAAYAQMSEPVGAMHHEDAGHHGAAMPQHDNGHHQSGDTRADDQVVNVLG